MHTEVDQHEAPEPTINLEAELGAPLETTDDESWQVALWIDVPALDATYCCRVGIGQMSSVNADTRLVLRTPVSDCDVGDGAILDVVQQTVMDPDRDDSWDTGDEREVRGGERLVLEYRRGHGESASIRRAHIFIESCDP